MNSSASCIPIMPQLLKLLPHRSRHALHTRASEFQITKPVQGWTANEVARLRTRWREAPRAELIAEFPRHSWRGIQRKGAKFGIKRRPWRPKQTGHKMLDQIRQRAADLRISLKDLDRICVGRSYFGASSRGSHPTRRNILLRAIAALGGRVEIVWR